MVTTNILFYVYEILNNLYLVLEPKPAATAKVTLFQIEYYQQFFNIDTMEVVDRVASSIIPKRAPASYLKTHLVSILQFFNRIKMSKVILF